MAGEGAPWQVAGMLWLGGCLYISDEDLAIAQAERVVAVPEVQLSSVEADWGLTTGGEDVVLTGKNLGDDVEVRFGETVAEVLSADPERMHVRAPARDEEGAVEVVVQRGESVDRIDGAYTYWANGTDLIGAMGSVWYFQRRGGYWASSEQDSATLQFRLIEPAPAYDYKTYWAAELDTCEVNPVTPYSFTAYNLGGIDPDAVAQVASGDTVVDAPWDVEYQGFVQPEFPVRTLLTTQPWKLLPLNVEDTPGIATTELFVTPASWELVTPKIDGATETRADVNGLHVTWTNAGGSAVLLQLGLIKSGGDGFEAEVFCSLVDDGSFDVPATITEGWGDNRELHILIGRYVEPTGVIEFNGSKAAVMFVDWRYGALRSE
ncbi:hypothetical protein LBMAG42_26280 [Deltaproteobacteria bacterium]|nr:hypothetical protein LBMAG42_26280 [Deltaproteobacteria bacterium]